MTLPTQRVLRAMLVEPAQEMSGLQIGKAADLPSGTIHPILARLEAWGWLGSRWEDIGSQQDRLRRRYYRLSSNGVEHARTAMARACASRSVASQLRVGFAGGAL